jgi:hypothetical protein
MSLRSAVRHDHHDVEGAYASKLTGTGSIIPSAHSVSCQLWMI